MQALGDSPSSGTPQPLPAWQAIGFVDDVFRHSFWPAKEFFYELLGTPLQAVLGQPTPPSVRQQMWRTGNTITPKHVSPFPNQTEAEWLAQYRCLTPENKRLLATYLARDTLYICYEGSPGLLDYLNELGVTFIDMRISPIRFLPDVVLAMRSNSPEINRKLSTLALSRYEIQREATKLGASFRHRDRYTPEAGIPRRPDAQIAVVGQTASDASIIVDDRFFKLGNAIPVLTEALRDKHVLYLRHPSAGIDHAQSEINLLKALYPYLEISQANSYDLLCCDQQIEFIGISSGLLQEAAFFGRKSTSLLPPICPLAFAEDPDTSDGYRQVTFDTIMKPEFWGFLLGHSGPIAREGIDRMQPNQLRELHNVWWGYPAHKVKPNDFSRALLREFQPEFDRVFGASRFVMDLLVGPQTGFAGDEISRRRWRWPNGSVVSLEPDSIVHRNGARAGIWRKLPATDPTFFVIWDEGYWIDLIRLTPDGRLVCRNNLGSQFIIPPA